MRVHRVEFSDGEQLLLATTDDYPAAKFRRDVQLTYGRPTSVEEDADEADKASERTRRRVAKFPHIIHQLQTKGTTQMTTNQDTTTMTDAQKIAAANAAGKVTKVATGAKAKAATKAAPKAAAKGAKAKAAPKAATKGAPKGPRPDNAAKKITLLVKENPKREGTASHQRFALYKSGMTVGEFCTKGGTMGDVKWDADHGYISIK